MTAVRLRPHHLLCMLTYIGRGYSPEFVRNYNRIAARLSAGAAILLVEGPDDICAPLCRDPCAHCHLEGPKRRDAEASRAVGRLLGRRLRSGSRIRLSPEMLDRMRAAFAAGETRDACAGCEWAQLCNAAAQGGFAGARLARRGAG